MSRGQGKQSPGGRLGGAGPTIGGPDQMSMRPHDRSTRAPSPHEKPGPWVTSPERTVSSTSDRPFGKRTTACHGSGGSDAARRSIKAPGPTGIGLALPLSGTSVVRPSGEVKSRSARHAPRSGCANVRHLGERSDPSAVGMRRRATCVRRSPRLTGTFESGTFEGCGGADPESRVR